VAADLLDRLKLIDRVMRDPRCTAADKMVTWALFWGFYSGDTGRCDPSANAIAARAHVDRRHVVRAIRHLEELGYLRVDRLQGTLGKYGPTNAYVPVFGPEDTRGQHCHPMATMPPGEGVAAMPSDGKNVLVPHGSIAIRTKEREPKKREGLPQLPLDDLADREPDALAEPRPKAQKSKRRVVDGQTTKSERHRELGEMFDEQFWPNFPPRRRSVNGKDRDDCRNRFIDAVESGEDAQAIIEGVKRYAASEDATKDQGKYACAPAVFINQKRWQRQLPPARQARTWM
jgi:hypothetical protein